MTEPDPEIVEASKRSFFSGLVSAASDIDPTTVATIAIAGASFVYRLEWLVILVVPLFSIVQAIGTQVAAVARGGLQECVRRRYGLATAWFSFICIVSVNVITYAADLAAGADALQLVTHVAYKWWLVPLSVAIAALLSFGTFERVRGILIVLPLAFLAYVATAFAARPDWHAVAAGIVPHLQSGHGYIATCIALLGTTLTTYSYYWQTVEVAAEPPPRKAVPLVQLMAIPGTLISGAVLWFIFIGTAATLGVHGRSVETAQDAARALAPVAGAWASLLFAAGLFGSAMLALPVLAAGTANAAASTFRWSGSLDKRPRDARRYYAILFAAVGLSTAFAFLNVPPVTLLFVASIAGGFATPVTLALLVLLSRDRKHMGSMPVPRWLAASGWVVTLIVTAASIAFVRWH